MLLFVALTTFCPSAWGKGCNKEQKRALLEIRNSTDGLAFKDFDGTGDCCGARENIYCTDRGLPYYILLSDIKPPSGTWIPNVTSFTLFGELEVLDLSFSNIGGELEVNITFHAFPICAGSQDSRKLSDKSADNPDHNPQPAAKAVQLLGNTTAIFGKTIPTSHPP